MEVFTSIIGIIVSALITNNIIFSQTLGLCPFLGVSKKVSNAVGMGLAVTFVITLSSLICYVLFVYVLEPLGLAYLQIILFILIIASLVQVVEILLKRFSPAIYTAMGIYLPLITTNCAVLGTAQAVVSMNFGVVPGIVGMLVHSVCIGLGFLLALVLMAGVRERVARCPIPKSFQGFPIALITAGLIAMAFFGLSGINFFA